MYLDVKPFRRGEGESDTGGEALAGGAYQNERAYGEDDGLAATSLLPLPRRREEVLPLPAHAALSGWVLVG